MLYQFFVFQQRSHPTSANKGVSILVEDFDIFVLSNSVEGFTGDVVIVDLLNDHDFV